MNGWNAGDREVRGVNVLGTLAHYPALAKAFCTFNAHVAGASTLTVRDREIVILRLSWLRRSEYEYGQHLILGRRAGLDDDELRRLEQGPDAAGWSPEDADLVRAVDELHALSRITRETWARLAQRYDQSQMLDLLFLVGCYDALALAINSLETPAEGDAATLLDDATRERMAKSRAAV
ncbi:carboxymuconolactone decarboxylase family protein [Solimonas terrae]|uniref:Carboxymuconolactone decarboxylase family protein n=2 Tax=Solimonas terrae TaxID=1396819 RepID=A0A6M2BMZ9_9GAMM|nr:carboxymuconolactone decarboxylase family protein [Solimonas terrae]NGY03986.1 carboxymuconolactone decarboxylase family protein [Solimonas terrae]